MKYTSAHLGRFVNKYVPKHSLESQKQWQLNGQNVY